jgi:hypothetical protein
MYKLKVLTFAIFTLLGSTLAQANDDNSAKFQVISSPTFRLDNTPDSANSTGLWTSLNNTHTSVDTRELIDPATGQWSDWTHRNDMHRVSGPPLGLGENEAVASTPYGNAYAAVNLNSLGTAINANPTHIIEGRGLATWDRTFQLNANSSATFSGLVNLNLGGQNALPSLASFSSTNLSANSLQGSLAFENPSHDVGTRLTATVNSPLSNPAQVFSYSSDQNGVMSLTITNTSNNAISGSLGLSSWVNITSPVPEPAAYLSMLLGLGIVGAMARRKAI